MDFNKWHHQALADGIHPHVMSFLHRFQDRLHNPGVRRWQRVSDALHGMIPSTSRQEQMAVFQPMVGAECARAFIQYRELIDELPPVADVISGNTTQIERATSTAARAAMALLLVYELKRLSDKVRNSVETEKLAAQTEFDTAGDRCLQFVMSNLPPEYGVTFIRVALIDFRLAIRTTKTFDRFADRYKDLVLAV